MFQTREQWLEAAVKELRPLYKPHAEVPPVRVCMGFPPKKAFGKKQILGVCCMSVMTADSIPQVYINPTVSELGGGQGILSILAHELVHACGISGHGKEFRKLGMFVGLEGKMSSSTANESLQAFFERIITKLGSMPHANITNSMPRLKPDTCRMFKCSCGKCGYTVRISRKWIGFGVPKCPVCDRDLEKDAM